MDLENVSSKNLNELEQTLTAFQLSLRKAGLQNDPLALSLQEFKRELEQLRRARFDASNPQYSGY